MQTLPGTVLGSSPQRVSALAALLVGAASLCAPARADPPRWVCTEAPAGTVEAAPCERSAAILQPCRAAAIPGAVLEQLGRERADAEQRARDAEGDLAAERRLRAQDATQAERVQTVLRRERDDARAGRAACETEGARCREQLAGAVQPAHWTLPRLVGVAVAGAGALLAGVACATVRGEGERAAACGAAGLSLGVAVGLSW